MKEIFKENRDKLEKVFVNVSSLENCFMVEYYYRTKSNIIGIEYFDYGTFNEETLMRTIIQKYNNYMSNTINGRKNIIEF